MDTLSTWPEKLPALPPYQLDARTTPDTEAPGGGGPPTTKGPGPVLPQKATTEPSTYSGHHRMVAFFLLPNTYTGSASEGLHTSGTRQFWHRRLISAFNSAT